MWFLVSQPNSVVIEVKVDGKAKGQEVLEKACSVLGISAESDYFGLRILNGRGGGSGVGVGGKKRRTANGGGGKRSGAGGGGVNRDSEPSSGEEEDPRESWLNLRNPVERQLPSSSAGSSSRPQRVKLRVKFWVPPHLVLQESTRHQMYLEVLSWVLSGRSDSLPRTHDGRLRLASLLCQAESGDYSEEALRRRLPLAPPPPPPPHPPASSSSSPPPTSPSFLPPHLSIGDALGLDPSELANGHSKLKGMKRSTAEYWVLKEVSSLDNFGEEIFCFKDHRIGIGPQGVNIYKSTVQAIPYSAIRSASSHRRLFKLWYLSDSEGTGNNNNNQDDAGGERGGEQEILFEIKCQSGLTASGLYRTLTEKHAFYSCDTVRGAVTAQYIRDLKGTIVSIFNESSASGKKYVFDIRRTCREVHDNARRALYYNNNSNHHGGGESQEEGDGGEEGGGGMGKEGPSCSRFPPQAEGLPCSTEDPLRGDDRGEAGGGGRGKGLGRGAKGGGGGGGGGRRKGRGGAEERLANLVDALTCRICMDAVIDTALFPCAHVICCNPCASRIIICPLCRSNIQSAKRIYLPTNSLDLKC